MKASDIMAPHVVAVAPDYTVGDVADILVTHGIGAVPVVEHGRLVGIVGEEDLLRRTDTGTSESPRAWWLELFTDETTLAADFAKCHARPVRDVMTRDVVTTIEETPLLQLAELFEKHRIQRIPVLREGRVVGIVSQADLIRALAAAAPTSQARGLDDRAILAEVLKLVGSGNWGSIRPANIAVSAGVVKLWGILTSEEERMATRVVAESIPGVRAVEDHRIFAAVLQGQA